MDAEVLSTGKAPVAVFKKRGSKATFRKRPATPPPADSSASEYSSEDDESGHKIKRRRKANVITASSSSAAPKTNLDSLSATKFSGDRSTVIESSNDATKQSNWYDEDAPDALSARSLLGTTRPSKGSKESSSADAAANHDGSNSNSNSTYKGVANYQTFIQKNPDAPQRQFGPIKAPTNIRTITVTDYAPDVCKDYKLTGFCGFGDSCKFLHAREVVQQGWALDRDWEIQTKGKKLKGTIVASANRDSKLGGADGDDEDAALLEKIPFACIICKKPYKNPVVTRCGHYYCESCALQRYKKSPNCVACGAGTNGVFNVAKNLEKLLERKRNREERLKKAEANDDDDDDDDNDEDNGSDE